MSMVRSPRIGLVAASSAVPPVEFQLGLDSLRAEFPGVRVHPHVFSQHFHFAGTDDQRAGAFFEYANAPDLDVLWCARGGYGATRLLPLLDELTQRHGVPPRKLLVGYSDVTVLHEFVRSRWNWSTLHAPMPAASSFPHLKPHERSALHAFLRGDLPGSSPWPEPLRFLVNPPRTPDTALLVGGNLTLWTCLLGTPFAPRHGDHFLFLEEVNEKWYQVDRMVTQLRQAGALGNVRGFILGDFLDCTDDVLMGLPSPGAAEKVELRKRYNHEEAILEIFGGLARELSIPLAAGLPVGHGPSFSPLPLGVPYTLHPSGQLAVDSWVPWLSG